MEKASSLCEQLKIELKEYDLIDLLEKLSCLRFLILTNSIKCIEEERRKAHKKREYVKELKARIERIQKEKEEKIAKVKNGKSEEK